MTEMARRGSPELGAAIAAGPAVRREHDVVVPGVAFASVLRLAALAAATVGALSIAISRTADKQSFVFPGSVLVISAVVLSHGYLAGLARLGGRRFVSIRPALATLVRLVFLIVYVASWIDLSRGRQLELALPISTAIAADVVQTIWTMRTPPPGWRRLRESAWIKLGLVIAIAVIAAAILIHSEKLVAAIALFLGVTLLTFVQVRLLTSLRDRSAAVIDRSDLAQAAEHKRRSDWMHDEVISLLTGVQMKFEHQHLDAKGVSLELRALDHQLRLRQSEEALRSGAVTLGDLLQPYLRFVENFGGCVTEAPAFESASCRVGEYDGRRVQRVFGVTIPNAVAAGASEVAIRFRLDLERSSLVVEVEDDGGGFDWTQLRAGGGLDTLRRDVGPEHMTFESAPSGTRIVVELSLPTMVMT